MFVANFDREKEQLAIKRKGHKRIKSYNQQRNEFRHFALKGLFDIFLTSKGENIAFPPPSPPCNVAPLFELPIENTKNTPTLGQGRGVDSFVL